MSKETKKLNVEELEKREAPFVIVQQPTGDDPIGTGGDPTSDPGGQSSLPSAPNQPGNSDDHRDKLWHENQP